MFLKSVKKLFKIVFSDLSDKKVLIILFTFLFINALKITIFNYYLSPIQTIDTFNYKFVVTLLFIIAVYPVIFKIKLRFVFIFIYIVQALYIVVNISYYIYFHNYLHFLQWITLFKEASISVNHFAAPLTIEYLITIIDLPMFIFILFNYKRMNELLNRLGFQRKAIMVFSFFVILCIESQNYIHGYSLVQYTSDRFRGESPIVQRYGTIANNIINLYSSTDEKSMINKLCVGKDQFNTIEAKLKPNFVMIQVESMDSSIINSKYEGRHITPFLHASSLKNIYFPYVLSYHLGGGTSDSEFSIINSIEPLTDYPAIKLANYNYPNSMIRALTGANYSSVAFHGNVGDFYNRDVAFPKMGFENFLDINKMNMKNVGWGAPDGDVFNYSFNYLKTLKQPFISYTITMTSHGPFTNARYYYNNNRYDKIKDQTVKEFFNSMSYVDQSIKDFVTQIQENFKNTYVLIWGDHTPNINTDLYNQAAIKIDNKYFEFVPLIIISPDNKHYIENKKAATFLDISPTILKISGIPFNIKSNGYNLLDSIEPNANIQFKGDNYNRSKLFDTVKIEVRS
jgi:lipoteichoic acid synthase